MNDRRDDRPPFTLAPPVPPTPPAPPAPPAPLAVRAGPAVEPAGEVVELHAPLRPEDVDRLRAGMRVLLTGELYAARDAAHARLYELLTAAPPGAGTPTPATPGLPFNLRGAVIYYVGPTPPPPGRVIGSAGPTTAGRMDRFTPALIRAGIRGMIGKGSRSAAVKQAMQEYGAVYFAAVGGAGVLLARHIKEVETIAYEDLGPEAIRRLWVEKFPVIVAIDRYGSDLYAMARSAWRSRGESRAGGS